MRRNPFRVFLALVAGGLLAPSVEAVADPWGLSVDADPYPNRGPWDQQAQRPDWAEGQAEDRSGSGRGGPPSALNGPGASVTAAGPVAAYSGWRFRGDPSSPNSGGMAVGGAPVGSYRFRPLTERELIRQGGGVDGAAPGTGSGQRPPVMGPTGTPDAPEGFGFGPWPP